MGTLFYAFRLPLDKEKLPIFTLIYEITFSTHAYRRAITHFPLLL